MVKPTWSSLPQFVQRYVPDETSLPAGSGSAIVAPLRHGTDLARPHLRPEPRRKDE